MSEMIRDYIRSRFEDAFVPISDEEIEIITKTAIAATIARLGVNPLDDLINGIIKLHKAGAEREL